MTSKPQAH